MRKLAIGLFSLILLLVTGLTPAGAARGGDDCKATNKADRIVLTGAGEVCNGRGGDDVLKGRGGVDHLKGGRGEDTIAGGSGRDRLVDSSREPDTGKGGSGDDYIDLRDTRPGNDTADGGPGFDICLVDTSDEMRNCESTSVDPTPPPPPPPPPPPSGDSDLAYGTVTSDRPTHEQIVFGQRLTYTIQVTNVGAGTATGVSLKAEKQSLFLRPYVTFDAPGTCTFGTDSAGGGTAVCPLPNISPGATITLTLTGIVGAPSGFCTYGFERESFVYQFIATASNDPNPPPIGSVQNLGGCGN